MLGARFVGEVYADGKRLTDPDGWLTGVAENTKHGVMKHLHNYVYEKLVPAYISEHHVEYHIIDRITGETIII